MIELASSYIDHYKSFSNEREETKLPWLNNLRQDALLQLQKVGLPNSHLEDWKYTDLSILHNHEFSLPCHTEEPDLSNIELLNEDFYHIVFVNGKLHHIPDEINSSFTIKPLNQCYSSIKNLISPITQPSIRAINTLFMDQGVVIDIKEGTILEKPIHLVYLTTENQIMSHLRNVILSGKNSQCQIIENHIAQNNHAYFSTVITDIHSAENSLTALFKVTRESENSYHVSQNNVIQAANSQFDYHSFDLSGKLIRHDINSELNGAGANCNLYGLFALDGKQHVDTHSRVAHNHSHTYSNEIFKGIADGRSKGIFNGKVIVKQDAQQINAAQQSKNILLSNRAEIDTKPELEIYADDVKCSHGATVGNLNEDSLFYLQSRGVDLTAAKNMLIHGFAKEIVNTIDLEILRKNINAHVVEKLNLTGRRAS